MNKEERLFPRPTRDHKVRAPRRPLTTRHRGQVA